jgi:hypothetical protein
MSDQVIFNRKPSIAIGYLPDGTMEVFAIGDASETLDAFKAERAKLAESKYQLVAWFRKMKSDKFNTLHEPPVVDVNIDISEFDGKEVDPERVEQLKAEAAEAAEKAAAAIVTGDLQQNEGDPEPPSDPEQADESQDLINDEPNPEPESKPKGKGKGKK